MISWMPTPISGIAMSCGSRSRTIVLDRPAKRTWPPALGGPANPFDLPPLETAAPPSGLRRNLRFAQSNRPDVARPIDTLQSPAPVRHALKTGKTPGNPASGRFPPTSNPRVDTEGTWAIRVVVGDPRVERTAIPV